MFYWFLKWIAIGPVLRVVFRPHVSGSENVPEEGPAILASNHLSYADWLFMPLTLSRRVTFVAKAEYFNSPGIKGWFQQKFFSGAGQVPIDRTSASAAEDAIQTGLRILRDGQILGIYPEGTRSPDGRLYRGAGGTATAESALALAQQLRGRRAGSTRTGSVMIRTTDCQLDLTTPSSLSCSAGSCVTAPVRTPG